MKALNRYIHEAMFTIKGEKNVRDMLELGRLAVIVDSSDVYHHVSLHPKSRKFTRVIFVSTVYEYRALPMKLHYSPKIFYKNN